MRLLLDECVPRRLANAFPQHDVRTVQQMGWSGKRNGELIALMKSAGFEVLLTVDKKIQFEQNIPASGVAVVVLMAFSNDIVDIQPFVPHVETALRRIKAGEVLRLEL